MFFEVRNLEVKPVDVRKTIRHPSEPGTEPPNNRHLVIPSADWPAYTKYFGAREPKAVSFLNTQLIWHLADDTWVVREAETEKEGE